MHSTALPLDILRDSTMEELHLLYQIRIPKSHTNISTTPMHIKSSRDNCNTLHLESRLIMIIIKIVKKKVNYLLPLVTIKKNIAAVS